MIAEFWRRIGNFRLAQWHETVEANTMARANERRNREGLADGIVIARATAIRAHYRSVAESRTREAMALKYAYRAKLHQWELENACNLCNGYRYIYAERRECDCVARLTPLPTQ